MRRWWKYVRIMVFCMAFILGALATWILCPEVLIVMGVIILIMCVPHK